VSCRAVAFLCFASVADNVSIEDGKEMNLDLQELKIKDIMVQVDRHSRMLGRQEELSG